MWPRRSRAAGWLLALLLPAVHVQSELTIYGKLGGNVSLTPGNVDAPITSILWREDMNIAIEWDGLTLDPHRHYKDRAKLDTTTGVMTITGLVREDSNTYTPEINDKKGEQIRLVVISAVPLPEVSIQYLEENRRELTCTGNTTGAEPVKYVWKFDDNVEPVVTKILILEKERSENVKELSCELENKVSRGSSQRVANPFTSQKELNISSGGIVFISLLGAVLLLVVVHRLKAGEWFYEKGYMPWKADFWRKQETEPTDPAVSNGTSAAPQHRPSHEETPLT